MLVPPLSGANSIIKPTDFCHLVEKECVGKYGSTSYKTACDYEECQFPLDYRCTHISCLDLRFKNLLFLKIF